MSALPVWGTAEAGRTWQVGRAWFQWDGARWNRVGERLCAWCQASLGPAVDLGPGVVTHGLCDRCKPELEAEIEEIAREVTPKCPHGHGPNEWCTPCEAET